MSNHWILAFFASDILAVDDREELGAVHKLTYLRLSGKRLGLLINFNEELIKDGITRIVNGLEE